MENLQVPEQLTQCSRKESLEIKRILVGVSGGSASGKTTICQNIKKEMTFNGDIEVLIISLDSFYKPLGPEVNAADYDFDSPNALDFELALECLQSLLEGKQTHIPRYNFCTHSRETETDLVNPTDIILFEGILSLYDADIRELMAYQVFMHTDDDIRLCRRLMRDSTERGRAVDNILQQYNRFVKKSYDLYIKPTMNYADIIVPGRDKNHVSVQFIVDYLKTKAIQMGLLKKMVKREEVIIADMVDGNEFQSKEDMENYQKVFIIPIHQDDQKQIKSNLYLIKDSIFGNKMLGQVFKELTKTAIKLWHRLCIVEETNIEDVGVADLKQIFKDIDNPKYYENQKKFVLLPVTVLTQEEPIYEQIFNNFKKYSPNSKIIFISLFANLKVLKKYNNQFENIKKIVNIFLIGNQQRFEEMIKINGEDQKCRENFYSITFQAAGINKTILKQIQKYKQSEKDSDSEDSD